MGGDAGSVSTDASCSVVADAGKPVACVGPAASVSTGDEEPQAVTTARIGARTATAERRVVWRQRRPIAKTLDHLFLA